MRIARGMFRLWLVASVLWVGGVGIVTLSKFSPSDPWAAFNPQLAGLPPGFVLDAPQHNPQSTTINVESPDGVIHQFPDGTTTEVIEREMRVYWRNEGMTHAAKVALIPPALMLVLGSALGWAFRGFRS
jgi:hypothetical protein